MASEIFILGKGFSTFVRSVAIVCEEKGIDYEVSDQINGKPVALRSEALHELHPFGKIPVVLHRNAVLVESSAIVRYLDRTFGPESLQGQGGRERFLCDQWSQLITIYVDRYLLREFMLELAFPRGPDGRPRMDIVERGRPSARRAVEVLADQLADKDYLVGNDFTLADALLAPIILYNNAMPSEFNLVSGYTNLSDYVARLDRRPSIQRVLKSLSIPETA